MKALRNEIAPGVFRIIPAPDLSYEWRERQRIMCRDWSRVHRQGDRAPPLPFFDRIVRTWRG
jgi:hypothetical protein